MRKACKKAFLKYVYNLIWVASILGICAHVRAAEPIDFTKDGQAKLEVSLETLDDPRPVQGASLILYQLQKYDSQNGFVWKQEFMDCDISIDGLTTSERAKAAAGLAEYARKHQIAGIQQTTDENGITVYTGLEFGMYLLVWESGPKNVEKMSPFLVSVPLENQGNWLYDVVVEPKVEEKKEAPAPTEEPEEIPPEETTEETTITEEATEEITETIETDPQTGTVDPIPKLPQTGPNRWLIFFFGIAGILLFGSGVYTKAGKRLHLSKFLMGVGILCLLASVGILGYQHMQEQMTAEQTDEILAKYENRYLNETQDDSKKNGTIGIEIDGELYGGILSIPTLGIVLPVDMQLSYENLKKTPCCYKGNVREDSMIIAAHNYARHFGNLSLLKEGDEVHFVDAKGVEYHYIVSESEILGAYDVEEMEEGDWDLTLFTCTYGGQARITVRCIKENL